MAKTRYPKYYYRGYRRIRYAAWHLTGLHLCELSKSDTALDIGAQAGIWGGIVRRTIGCRVMDVDLSYPLGMHGERIGADAGRIPLSDGAVTQLVSFCAFNCFEGNADVEMLREASRLLLSGGRIVIVPFCIGDAHVNLYDPRICEKESSFDAAAHRISWPGWGNNFGRWYDRSAFEQRVLSQLDNFTPEIIAVHHDFTGAGLESPFYAARFTKVT